MFPVSCLFTHTLQFAVIMPRMSVCPVCRSRLVTHWLAARRFNKLQQQYLRPHARRDNKIIMHLLVKFHIFMHQYIILNFYYKIASVKIWILQRLLGSFFPIGYTFSLERSIFIVDWSNVIQANQSIKITLLNRCYKFKTYFLVGKI